MPERSTCISPSRRSAPGFRFAGLDHAIQAPLPATGCAVRPQNAISASEHVSLPNRTLYTPPVGHPLAQHPTTDKQLTGDHGKNADSASSDSQPTRRAAEFKLSDARTAPLRRPEMMEPILISAGIYHLARPPPTACLTFRCHFPHQATNTPAYPAAIMPMSMHKWPDAA